VLYRFAGMTSSSIADRYVREGKALEESTVLKGIKAAAEADRMESPGPTTADPEPESSITSELS